MSNQGVVRLLLEQLSDPEITVRSMFGGEGIFLRGLMFGLVYEGVLYMKVSKESPMISSNPPFTPRAGRTFPSLRAVPAADLRDAGRLALLSRTAQQAAAAPRK